MLILAAGAAPAAAVSGPPPSPEAREVARLRAVIDGGTFEIDDGRIVRLAAIRAPDGMAAGGRSLRGPGAWIARAAREALAEIAEGRVLVLAITTPVPDRHGRVRAQAIADGLWVQAELVARGLARVDTRIEDRAHAAALLAREAEARGAGRGLWALPEYRVLTAEAAARFVDSFQIVEGRVRAVGQRGGRTWLNFGADWRSDFTVLIAAPARRLFTASSLDPVGYEGKMIRVRGWVRAQNGPLIEIMHPEQIEVVER